MIKSADEQAVTAASAANANESVTNLEHGWVELSDHCVVSFRGSAARDFLGRQLTCDINELEDGKPQFGAWLTPKGRVLALLRLFNRGPNQVEAIVPSALAAELIQRMRLFVMRDDVNIEIDPQQVVIGMWGDCVAAINSDVSFAAQATTIHLANRPPLAMCCGSVAGVENLSGEHVLTRSSPAQWQTMCIEAGLPQVELATREAFIPQMINLDRLGGVSFSKGCYPGQEIVARTQHLGRIKRRMFVIRAARDDGQVPPRAGDVVVGAGGETIGGRVVSAGSTSRGTVLLAVLPLESDTAAKPLHLHDAPGTKLEVFAPPYSLRDTSD
jgi:folate-binding protein YgfZ